MLVALDADPRSDSFAIAPSRFRRGLEEQAHPVVDGLLELRATRLPALTPLASLELAALTLHDAFLVGVQDAKELHHDADAPSENDDGEPQKPARAEVDEREHRVDEQERHEVPHELAPGTRLPLANDLFAARLTPDRMSGVGANLARGGVNCLFGYAYLGRRAHEIVVRQAGGLCVLLLDRAIEDRVDLVLAVRALRHQYALSVAMVRGMRWSVTFTVCVVACEPDTRAPIQTPDQLDTIAVGECDTLTLEVYNGPASPFDARNIVAQCEDAAVCSAEVREHGSVIVRAVAQGRTIVSLAFDHPVTNEHVKKRIPIVVIPQRTGGDMLHPRIVGSPSCP